MKEKPNKTGENNTPFNPQELLDPEIAHMLSWNIGNYTSFADPALEPNGYDPAGNRQNYGNHLQFAAQSKLIGIEPRNPDIFLGHDYSLLAYFRKFGANRDSLNEFQQAHEELLADSAYGKIMGAFINLDDNTRNLISKEINERDPGEHLWGLENIERYSTWDSITYAKLLGIGTDFTERDRRDFLAGISLKEKGCIYNCRLEGNSDNPTLLYVIVNDTVSALAQARILGFEIPLDKNVETVLRRAIITAQKPEKMANYGPDGITYATHMNSVIGIPKLLSNYSIIKAKEIKVGGPRGLELVF